MPRPMLDWIVDGALELIAPRRCPGCDVASRGFCDACAPLIEAYRGGGAACVYGGPVKDAICRFKYAGRTDLVLDLAALFLPLARRVAPSLDAIVAVPVHPKKLRARGFHPAGLLARAVARETGLRVWPGRLIRPRPTPPQASLPRAARIQNARDSFRCVRSMAGARLLLIDDVKTTGATLAEARRTLEAAGADQVVPIALAAAED